MLLTILIVTLLSQSKWTNLELFTAQSSQQSFRWRTVSKLEKVTLLLVIMVNFRYFFENSNSYEGQLVDTNRIVLYDIDLAVFD